MPASHYSKVSCINGLKLFVCIIGMLLISDEVYSQKGRPFLSNYPPITYATDEMGASPQNWCVTQDGSGRILVANSSGVLLFDGIDWKMVPNTKEKLLYKFATEASGRVYTGGLDEIGYFISDDSGSLSYRSMVSEMNDADKGFGRIMNVIEHEGAIYFRSKSHLIRYKKGVFKVWKPEERFIKLVSSDAGLFVSEPSKWYEIQEESLVTILKSKASESLPNLRGAFPSNTDSTLILTKNDGLFHLRDGYLRKIPFGVEQLTVMNACKISENLIGLATNDDGVIIINLNGEVVDVFDERTGLESNGTKYIDYFNGELWIALNTGIARIEYPMNSSFIDKTLGLKNVPATIRRFGDDLLIGAIEDAYWLRKDGITQQGKLVQLERDLADVLGVVNVGTHAVISNAEGFYIIGEDGNSFLIERNRNDICSGIAGSNTPEVFHGGFGNSVTTTVLQSNSRQYDLYEAKVGHLTNSLCETTDGNLWAAYLEISYIDYSDGYENPKITTLDASNGMKEEMGFIEVSRINGEVVFGTSIGAYTFNHKIKKLVPYKRFGKKFYDGSHIAYNLTEMRNGDVWITTNNQTGILRLQDNNTFVYDSLPIIRAPLSDVWEIFEDEDDIVWICGTEGIVRYDPTSEFDYKTPYKSFIREVIVNDTSTIFSGFYSDKNGFPSVKQPKSFIPELPYSENNITFHFGAAYFANDSKVDKKLEYSIMLVGKDKKWSKWRTASEINYTNLPEGEYTFKVRARNVYGNISEVSEYKFIVLPPWYRTTWAYIMFTVLGGLFIYGLIMLNNRRLRYENVKLEGMVAVRTEEVEQEKEKSDKLLENILPKEIAKELKTHGMTRPRHFDSVTVMFADFKGFTEYSENMSPELLVEELNFCFSAFDEIMLRNNVEKIKTIGDCYMAAGGLPTPNETHLSDVINAAKEMIVFMERRKKGHMDRGEKYLEIRIGIHTGPIVAGTVGINKFQYDIWGDTVNLASRMESNGVTGKINISEESNALLPAEITSTFRGEYEVKGKGMQKMYLIG